MFRKIYMAEQSDKDNLGHEIIIHRNIKENLS